MDQFPKFLGYAGALPLIILLPFIYLTKGNIVTADLTINLNFFYALLIICFMSGTHWINAVNSKNKIYVFLSIAPVLATLGLIYIHGFFESSLIFVGCAMVFAFIYLMDKKYHDPTQIPAGYLVFRRNLTLLVCALLTAGAFLGFEYK